MRARAIALSLALAACGGSPFTNASPELGDAQELDAGELEAAADVLEQPDQGDHQVDGDRGDVDAHPLELEAGPDAPSGALEGGDAHALEDAPHDAPAADVDAAGPVDAAPVCDPSTCPVAACTVTHTACCKSAGACGCTTLGVGLCQ